MTTDPPFSGRVADGFFRLPQSGASAAVMNPVSVQLRPVEALLSVSSPAVGVLLAEDRTHGILVLQTSSSSLAWSCLG